MSKTNPPAPAAGLSPGLRRFLFFTAATTGAVILIVEILGAKLLSPYLGTSHFVWTAQIGVTLLSLAAGYYLGGWLVDRFPDLKIIYTCILAAGVYLALSLPFIEPVAYGCLKFRLAMGSVLASLFLFFIPLTLLAAVGPFMVRILTRSVDSVGGLVGRLTAISTLGSVGGTLLIGYVLIPLWPNSRTLFATAAILLALSLAYFAIWSPRRGGLGQAVGLAALSILLGNAGARKAEKSHLTTAEELYRGNSNFGLMQVVEDSGSGYRYYLNDFLTQNGIDPDAEPGSQSIHMFTYMLHRLTMAYAPDPHRALCIGLGVGIAPMELVREGLQVDIVEINPAIVPIAREWFGLEPDRMNITIGDGREYLHRVTEPYDAILLDAFLGDSSPSHLMTREAFASMRQAMKPDGVLVINSFGDFEAGKDFFSASLNRTLREVFASVKIHHAGTGNKFFVASDRKPLDFAHQPNAEGVHFRAQSYVQSALFRLGETRPDAGMILTDDFNPVEFHDAANREELRFDLADNMRNWSRSE